MSIARGRRSKTLYCDPVPPARTTIHEGGSLACHTEDHEGCRHLIGRGGRIWPGPEPKGLLALCDCRCHADCPVTPGIVDEDEALYLSCSCFDHTAALERDHQRHAESERRRDALASATQKINSDMDRSQVRQTLEEELAARGVTISQRDLDYHADMIIASRRHDGGRSTLSTAFRYGKTLWRAIREHQPPQNPGSGTFPE